MQLQVHQPYMCHQQNTGTHCDKKNNPVHGIHKQAHQPSALVHVLRNTALWVKKMISMQLNREDGIGCPFYCNNVDYRKLILKLDEISICEGSPCGMKTSQWNAHRLLWWKWKDSHLASVLWLQENLRCHWSTWYYWWSRLLMTSYLSLNSPQLQLREDDNFW